MEEKDKEEKDKENIQIDFLEGEGEKEEEVINIDDILKEFEELQHNNEDEIIAEMRNYDLNYTNKQLLIICEYYGLHKKARTMKKQDIITSILFYEYQEENMEIVMKRKIMWSYMRELQSDKFMKRFVIW